MEFFVAESQKFLLVKCPQAAMSKENVCVHRLAGNWFFFTFGCYEYSHGLPGKSLHLFLGWSSHMPQPPPPPRKFLKSGSLRIHFQHSRAKIRVFEQNTDVIKFWLFYSAKSRHQVHVK